VRAKGSKANGAFSYRVVAKRKDIAAPRFERVELPSDRLTSSHRLIGVEPVPPIAA
jgi:hypothetical protein